MLVAYFSDRTTFRHRKLALDPAVHERGDEGEIAGQAIKLGNHELCLVTPARCQRLGKPGRALRLPLSISVCSATNFQVPAV